MPTPNRLAGTATLTVDGVSYALRGAFTYSPGTVTRSSIEGQDGIHGFKEKPRASWISAELTDASNLSVASLNAMTNVTVIASLANGKTIVGRGMWTTDAQDVETEDAKLTCKWEAKAGAVTEN